MSNLFKRNIVYLLIYFCLALLICFLVQMFLIGIESLKSNKSNVIILFGITFSIVLVILYFFLKKINIDPLVFFVQCAIIGPFIFGFCLVILRTLSFNEVNIIDRNYVGTSGTTEDENTNDDGGINTYYHNTYVFQKSDTSLTSEIKKINENYSEGVSKEEFIFWETGFVKGYEPKNIRGYNLSKVVSRNYKSYIYIALFTILECLINATALASLLLIIPFIGLLFGKRLFDNMDGLRKFYKPLKGDY